MKNKKILWIIIGALDVAIVGFLFVIHIIMLANVIGKDPIEVQELAQQSNLIGYFAGHITLYGFLVAIPFPLILGAGLFCVVFGIIRGKKLDQKQL